MALLEPPRVSCASCIAGAIMNSVGREQRLGSLAMSTEAEQFAKVYFEAIRDSPVGFCLLSWGDFVYLHVNRAFASMLGYEPDDLVGRSHEEIQPRSELAESARIKGDLAKGGPLDESLERQFLHRDGSVIWVEIHPMRVTDPDGRQLVVSQYLDVTARHQAQAERDALEKLNADSNAQIQRAHERLEHLYAEAVENSHIGHTVLSMDSYRYVQVNQAFADLLGYDRSDIEGHLNSEFVPVDQSENDKAIRLGIEAGQALPDLSRRRLRHRDGSDIWVDVSPVRLTDTDGSEVVVSQYADVTRIVKAEQAQTLAEQEVAEVMADLSFRSTHDLLTGLHNRQALIDGIDQRLRQHSGRFALLYIDIDNFKHINDAISHEAGDRVLEEFGRQLMGAIRGTDSCGRIGGDEFVVIADDVATHEDAVEVVHRLQERIGGTAISVGASHVTIRFSVGIAMSRENVSAQTLLQEADTALRRSKAAGKGRWQIYDDATRHEALRRLEVGHDLAKSLRQGEVTAYFQPIVNIDTGDLLGYEALARWIRQDTAVAASEWIDIAEEAGLIVDVGQKVVAAGIHRLAELPSPLTVAVNASMAEVGNQDFASLIEDRLTAEGADASRLIVEVTEQVLLQAPDSARIFLARLVEQGVQVHLDDFGTGYSSLTHLQELPVTGIKLDRSFTAALGAKNGRSDGLVAALGSLAEQLGLDTVAEGVETVEQAAALLRAGWHTGQGWLYGMAVPAPQTADLNLRSSKTAQTNGAQSTHRRRRTDVSA